MLQTETKNESNSTAWAARVEPDLSWVGIRWEMRSMVNECKQDHSLGIVWSYIYGNCKVSLSTHGWSFCWISLQPVASVTTSSCRSTCFARTVIHASWRSSTVRRSSPRSGSCIPTSFRSVASAPSTLPSTLLTGFICDVVDPVRRRVTYTIAWRHSLA